jgi:Tetratricopeptide repeat
VSLNRGGGGTKIGEEPAAATSGSNTFEHLPTVANAEKSSERDNGSDIRLSAFRSKAIELHHVLRTSMYTTLCILLTAAVSYGATPPSRHLIPTVSTQRFEIAYELEGGPESATTVELWYTTDEGRTWKNHGTVRPNESAVEFTAPEEGLYGFYIIAANQSGPSGDEPGTDTQPQLWAQVDYTRPVVQLHSVRQNDPPTIPQVVYLRWSAIDSNLHSRPINLAYRLTSGGGWTPIESSISNSGSYDWRVPETVVGEVVVQLSCRDRGGHRVDVESHPFVIRVPRELRTISRDPGSGALAASAPHRSVGKVDIDDPGQRAARLYRLGLTHARQGEFRLAASRFRDALSNDPGNTGALVELGRSMYAQQDMSGALEAYRLALGQEPQSRAALEGSALVHISQGRFADAVQELTSIVRTNPKDAAAWLNLGDVAIYQGDELLAREHYMKASTVDPLATKTISDAQLRMTDLQRLAEEFAQLGASK